MQVFLERIWQDLYHGARMLAKNPAFTLVAVISLAIGIGANCAMYSWADALLLRPLPVARPGEVVTVGAKASLAGFTSLVNCYPDFRDLRDRSRSFDNLTAFTNLTVGFTTKPDALPQMKFGVLVTGNLFGAMGVEPELGRSFRPDEDEVPGRDAVVILDHSLWEQQFAADRSILGRKVRMNGIDHGYRRGARPAHGDESVDSSRVLCAADDVSSAVRESESAGIPRRPRSHGEGPT
jgi:hypothetical protein